MGKIIYCLRGHKTAEIILLVLIALAAVSGWFSSGFPKGHDAVDYSSAAAFKESISIYHTIGEWTKDENLGSPLFYLEQPLVPLLLLILGFPLGWVVASKLLYFLIFALAGVFAYYYVYELTRSRLASFVGGLSYIFIPFHLIEVVFEGHWGVGMAYMLTPLVFLTTERTIKNPGAGKAILAGVLLALLILTHPQTFPILVGPFWVLYVVFRIWLSAKAKQSVKASLVACVSILSLGLLLTAFWWFPLLWEIDYLHLGHQLEASEAFSGTFLQIITLRPDSCCASSSAYMLSSSLLFQLLSWLAVLPALVGIIFNYKKKYVWFFTATILLIMLLALGTKTPIYGFAHDYLPFFSWDRTPVRFLLFSSFAYAVLIGFGVKSIIEWLKYPRFFLLVAIFLSLVVVANTWQESREAFGTFTLDQDREEATSWLSGQEEGRLMTIPLEIYIYSPEWRNIVNPMIYTWLHNKETVYGGGPTWASESLQSMREAAQEHKISMGEISDVLGIKYTVVDKTNPSSANYILDDSFTKVWESETIDIYKHSDPYPRIYALRATDSNIVSEADSWNLVEGTQDTAWVTPGSEYISVNFTLVHPGKYRVSINSAEPLRLILTESYYPGWVAKIDGQVIPSEKAYGFLNSWQISQPGEHELTLEFTPSGQRTADRIISLLTLGGILLFFLGQWLKARWCKKSSK